MQYTIKCPYCREEIKIQHVMEGVWAVSVDELAYEICATFVFSLGSYLDEHQDDEILALLETISGRENEQVRTVEQDLSMRPSESLA